MCNRKDFDMFDFSEREAEIEDEDIYGHEYDYERENPYLPSLHTLLNDGTPSFDQDMTSVSLSPDCITEMRSGYPTAAKLCKYKPSDDERSVDIESEEYLDVRIDVLTHLFWKHTMNYYRLFPEWLANPKNAAIVDTLNKTAVSIILTDVSTRYSSFDEINRMTRRVFRHLSRCTNDQRIKNDFIGFLLECLRSFRNNIQEDLNEYLNTCDTDPIDYNDYFMGHMVWFSVDEARFYVAKIPKKMGGFDSLLKIYNRSGRVIKIYPRPSHKTQFAPITLNTSRHTVNFRIYNIPPKFTYKYDVEKPGYVEKPRKDSYLRDCDRDIDAFVDMMSSLYMTKRHKRILNSIQRKDSLTDKEIAAVEKDAKNVCYTTRFYQMITSLFDMSNYEIISTICSGIERVNPDSANTLADDFYGDDCESYWPKDPIDCMLSLNSCKYADRVFLNIVRDFRGLLNNIAKHYTAYIYNILDDVFAFDAMVRGNMALYRDNSGNAFFTEPNFEYHQIIRLMVVAVDSFRIHFITSNDFYDALNCVLPKRRSVHVMTTKRFDRDIELARDVLTGNYINAAICKYIGHTKSHDQFYKYRKYFADTPDRIHDN